VHDESGRARALLPWVADRYSAARSLYEEGLELARRSGDTNRVADLLWGLGYLSRWQGEHQAAFALFADGLVLYTRVGTRLGAARLLEALLDWLRYESSPIGHCVSPLLPYHCERKSVLRCRRSSATASSTISI
jgi:hypothetical protein